MRMGGEGTINVVKIASLTGELPTHPEKMGADVIQDGASIDRKGWGDIGLLPLLRNSESV